MRVWMSLALWVLLVAMACPEDDGGAAAEGEGEGEGEGDGEPFVLPLRFVVDGVDVTDGGVDFGSVAAGATAERIITLQPVAGPVGILSEPPVLLGGRDVEQWSVVSQPPTLVPAGGATFTMRLAPTIGGELQGAVLLALGPRSDERAVLLLRGASDAPVREPGLRASVYDGTFDLLPDFDALSPTSTAITPTVDIGARAGTDLFAFRFVGAIDIPADGQWRFSTTSDDGSRLIVDGAVVVDNDGLHGPVTVSGGVTLTTGLHALEVQFFEKNGGELLDVTWEGPGVVAGAIPAAALFTAP